ncbi:hypothetical protein SCUP515_10119 [Seiridium cupressi]
MGISSSWHHQGNALFAALAAQCSFGKGKEVGSMSSSLYDTAWLSMVQKPAKTGFGIYVATTWLFPECFEFVLARQLPSEAWESYTTPVDGILKTAAALLSLIKHLKIQPDNQDWLLRSRKAKAALEDILRGWDMYSTDQVGQEILIISLLGLLEKEEIFIEFPQLSALRAVRDAKLAKIPSSTVYKIRSTSYHSLEAFIGYIDFDKVGQWQEANGSFMDSPATTAAYLMNSSSWDDKAESYLKDVVSRDNGGVPSAWPPTVFEISWVVTTLATFGVSPDPSDSLILRKTLREALEEQKGLLGFGMRKTGSFLARTPLIRDTEPGIVQLVELQACFALQALQRQPPDFFPRTAKGKDKYIFIIPLALLLCAEVHGCSISLSVLYEMMVLSILNFHADEYMGGVIEKHFSTDLDVIRGLVGQLFTSTHSHAYSGKVNGNTNGHSGEAKTINQGSETSEFFTNGSSPTTFDLEQQHDSLDQPSVNDVKAVLFSFIERILEHPAVQSSPARLQGQLASELQTFILAHIMHAEDNHRLRTQSQSNGKGTLLSNGNVVHSVNGNLTLQLAMAAYCPRHAPPISPRTPVANLCRMYNDYGSLERDEEEHALNSVNFPEFFYHDGKQASPITSSTSSGDAKSELLWIAEYERRGLDVAMNLLEKELGPGELMSALRMFVDVTDLYGQSHVLKDITAGVVVA